MSDDINFTHVPAKDQLTTKPVFYKMSIRFVLSLAPKDINNFMHDMGFTESIAVKNAKTVSIEQIVDFIPDNETLNQYSKAIKESYTNKAMEIIDAKFDGYNYLYRVQPEIKKRIVVLGGSFNPPTLAHQKVMQSIMAFLQAEKGIYVPNSDFYVTRKCKRNNTPFIFSQQERLDMLNSLCKNETYHQTTVSTCEYDDTSTGRTHTTLLEIQKQYPDYEIVFIMGSDKLTILPKWKLSDMLDQFKIAVMVRNNDKPTSIIQNNTKLAAHKDSFFILPRLNEWSDISSSIVQKKYFQLLKNPTIANAFYAADFVNNKTDEIIRKHIAATE